MIVVTGGAGFIGSVLIKALNDLGREDILVVDSFRNEEKWMNLRGLKYAEFVEPHLFSELLGELRGIEGVFHMGACSATTEKDMDFLYRNNVVFSQDLYNFCSELDIPFCYASSAATYGAGEFGYDDDHDQVRQLRPLNKYGYSKQIFDEWVLRQSYAPSVWFGVKFFNVYGPNEYHKGRMSSVVYQAYNQIKEEGKVKLFKSYKDGYKDGEQLRDFVYVKDVVRAMIELMTTDHGGENGLYNLGTGKARSFYDLVDATFKALKLKTEVEFIEMPVDIREQYQYFTEANMGKFSQAIPSFKFSSLEEGVNDYVVNHLENKTQHLDNNDEA